MQGQPEIFQIHDVKTYETESLDLDWLYYFQKWSEHPRSKTVGSGVGNLELE